MNNTMGNDMEAGITGWLTGRAYVDLIREVVTNLWNENRQIAR